MTTTSTDNKPAGNYAQVNGINLYYEIHGSGRPLIMLHGGFGTTDMFSALYPSLTQNRQVIAVDIYGHGRTALTDRPFLFEHLAGDIVALIQYLGLKTASLLGYSLGGAIALQTAINYPALIDKLIIFSSPFKREGWHPEIQAGMAATNPEFFIGTPMQATEYHQR